MKNNSIKLGVMFALLLIFCAVILTACTQGASDSEIAESCVRIHIRANSNSQPDQTVKLAVRDEITSYLSSKLEGCTDKNAAIRVLDQEKVNLTNIADNALKRNGFGYKSSISLKSEYFPEKHYDGYVFPEGCYDALIVELGEGVGDNWWCVAFPPLCFVPESGNGEKIVYKSWVKELLEKIFK